MSETFEQDLCRELDEDNEDTSIGLSLIAILQLKVKPNGRVDTKWGDKTPMGLARTVKRILEEDV